MKIKTLASIFGRNKNLTIYTLRKGEQWLSNGAAIYFIDGIPNLTPEVVLRIFDVKPDKRAGWQCQELELPEEILCFEDSNYNEMVIEPFKIRILYRDNTFWIFTDDNRNYAINADYIKPLLDDPEYLTFHKRTTSGGAFYLACKNGLQLIALIFPKMLHTDEEYSNEIKIIAKNYAYMNLNNIISAMDEVFGKGAEIDADTGEVTGVQNTFDSETEGEEDEND